MKTSIKTKKMRLKLATEKWRVDNWMKVIFNDESRICIGHGNNATTFFRSHSNEVQR